MILIITIYLINESSNCNNKNYENFDTTNRTVPPKYINDPNNYVFENISKNKKLLYDTSNENCNNDTCKLINNSILKKKIPENINKAEIDLINSNNPKWKFESTQENFGNNTKNVYHMPKDSQMLDDSCSRSEFLQGKLNNGVLERRWTFEHNVCPTMEISKNKWALNEGFVGDKGINDSKVLPYRSLPQQKITENFENQNVLTYAMSKCDDDYNNIGFDKKSEYMGEKSEAASIFQSYDENKLNNNVRLLDYLHGDVLHTELDDENYDNINELPTISNQSC